MDLASILKKIYPQGSQAGQCFEWLHKILDFPSVGDSLQQKKNFILQNGDCYTFVNINELGKGYRIGDIVFTSESQVFGHGALITDFDLNGNLVLAESNFQLDGKVRYGRILKKDDSKILGIGRFPFLIDLGVREVQLNLNVFFNKMKWQTGIFQLVSETIKQSTSGKLNLNLVPLMSTQFKNWWYESFPFGGIEYKVIAKRYLDDFVRPLLYPDMHGYILVIDHQEWEGAISGNTENSELAWTSYGKPATIQMSCEEADFSPWYFGMKAFSHYTIHEVAHYLAYINGKNDLTDILDTPQQKQLNSAFNFDWNRIALNI